MSSNIKELIIESNKKLIIEPSNEITEKRYCSCVDPNLAPEFLKDERFTLYSDVGRKYSMKITDRFKDDSTKFAAGVGISILQMTYLPIAEIVSVIKSENNGKNKEVIDYAYSGTMLVPRIVGDVVSGGLSLTVAATFTSLTAVVFTTSITAMAVINLAENIVYSDTTL